MVFEFNVQFDPFKKMDNRLLVFLICAGVLLVACVLTILVAYRFKTRNQQKVLQSRSDFDSTKEQQNALAQGCFGI